MEDGLRKRLVLTRQRLAAIDKELLDPEVTRDLKHFREISVERSQIEEVVLKFDEYEKAEKNIEEALLLMEEKDSEIAAFAKEEFKELSARLPEIKEEIRFLLIPKDPFDDKKYRC